jgi:hypothetical protein
MGDTLQPAAPFLMSDTLQRPGCLFLVQDLATMSKVTLAKDNPVSVRAVPAPAIIHGKVPADHKCLDAGTYGVL